MRRNWLFSLGCLALLAPMGARAEGPPSPPSFKRGPSPVLTMPAEHFVVERGPRIPFVQLERKDFKLDPGQKTVTLKQKAITFQGRSIYLRKAPKTISVEQFLREANELESKLNEFGYTLRDDKPIKIKYLFGKDQLALQKKALAHNWEQLTSEAQQPQVVCEGFASGKGPDSGRPKVAVPFRWQWDWSDSFGNDRFGVKLDSHLHLGAEQANLELDPFFAAAVQLPGVEKPLELLKLERTETKTGSRLVLTVMGEKSDFSIVQRGAKTLLDKAVNWDAKVTMPAGPFDLEGRFGFTGQAKVDAFWNLQDKPALAELKVTTNLAANAFAELGVGYEIVSVGVGGSLTLIAEQLTLDGRLAFQDIGRRQYVFTVEGFNDLTLLSGQLYVFGEIDALLYTKRFELELYNFDGFHFENTLFRIRNQNVPAERDKQVLLAVEELSGIGAATPRGERLPFEPLEFVVNVTVDGRTSSRTVRGIEASGIWRAGRPGSGAPRFEIPLLSYRRVPIRVEVWERYRLGGLELHTQLDLAKGPWKAVELCYDPGEGKFWGTTSGSEGELREVRGETSYWGERHHGLRFKIAPAQFTPAPAKAR